MSAQARPAAVGKTAAATNSIATLIEREAWRTCRGPLLGDGRETARVALSLVEPRTGFAIMIHALRAIFAGLALLAAWMPTAEASYESGLVAFERGDFEQALKDWLAEAEKGDARAQHNVGVVYDSGRGLTPDPVEARKWYERAAAQGLPEAQNNLGMLYSKGRGVEPDQARAIELWSTAARRRYPLAEFNLGLAYANGSGVDKDYDKARELFQSAAAKKLPDAQFALGQVYFQGFGVEPDPREARRWFELAAAHQYPEAREMLAKLDQEEAAAAAAETPPPEVQAASVPEPQAAPQPAAPEPAPAQEPSAVAETQSAAAPDEIRLWLGSLSSSAKAEQQWNQLRESFGDLFQDMDLRVAEVERDQRKFYRVLAGPVPDRDRGKEICRLMQERDPEAWCKVVGGR